MSILGKPRTHPESRINSRNWLYKQRVGNYLNSIGITKFEDQLDLLHAFIVEKHHPEPCVNIVRLYWDLFVHFVNNTDL